MLHAPPHTLKQALAVVGAVHLKMRIKILLMDQQVHKSAVLSLKKRVKIRRDLLRLMGIQNDIVLDEDDALACICPKIAC